MKELAGISGLALRNDVLLSGYTRFGLGGQAACMCKADGAESVTRALQVLRSSAVPHVVMAGGSNLVVSDLGFDGVVLRYTGKACSIANDVVTVEAGAILQDVVDGTIAAGLQGLETMTGIPGTVGAAVYGNAGAYGRSIQDLVRQVTATNGSETRTFTNLECHFLYRESIFKAQKSWLILSAELNLQRGDSVALRRKADEIRTIRDEKYPPTMKCAGSIFKNLLFDQLPAHVQAEVPPKLVREGKVPSAWFLEQVDAKGMRRGDIQVASYHANLIYNDGPAATAADLVAVIQELKTRVHDRFGFYVEEEVQYVGFKITPQQDHGMSTNGHQPSARSL